MISVIIPTFNEEAHIATTIKMLRQCDENGFIKEIIIADGGSTDNTVAVAKSQNAITVISPKKGRAAQMNFGAFTATGEILYFLHADTIPPKKFTKHIIQSIQQDYGAGCFMLSFDHNHWFLKANCWFTRFDINSIRFGDQSLFVTKINFEKVNGFREDHIVLEDQQIIKELKKIGRFIIIRKPVLTSARKYLDNGIYKTQLIFFIIYFMYRLGYSQKKLVATYRRLISQNKL
ncbi:glucosyl-3-phosphoglycerate synthase [mine drainage metagenome]|uniref:Glucosyl-3-phosphoglycerate synthase n=1 Tax=mine drainage metagenome TaxID=410659 RepID=A0A1J5RZJ9_9ZZZZ